MLAKKVIKSFLILIKNKRYEVKFSNVFCQIILIIHYVQIISFITETNQKNKVYDQLLKYFQDTLQRFRIRALLNYLDYNISLISMLSVIVFLFQLFMISYLIIKRVAKKQGYVLSDDHSIFKYLDRLYYRYVFLFQWLIFLPSVELYFNFIFCNEKQMVYRNSSQCASFSAQQIMMLTISLLGITLNILFVNFINSLFINDEFQDICILIRKFSSYQIIQSLIQVVIVAVYYGDLEIGTSSYLKYGIFLIYGILQILDQIKNMPFYNKKVQLIYGIININILKLSLLYFFYESLQIIQEFNIFYSIVLLQPVYITQQMIQQKNFYDKLIKFQISEVIEFYPQLIDYYLEEIQNLYDNQKNDINQLKLIGYLRNYIYNCKDQKYLIRTGAKFENFMEDNQLVFKLIQIVYRNFIIINQNNNLVSIKDQLTYTILKYCSFIQQRQQSLQKSFFDLQKIKKYQMRNSNKSNLSFKDLYLKTLITIKMKYLAHKILRSGEQLSRKYSKISKIYPMSLKYANTMRQYQTLKDSIFSKIVEIADLKQKYWNRLVDGITKIDDLKVLVINISEQIDKFKVYHRNILKKHDYLMKVDENLFFMKLNSIIGSIVYNDIKFKLIYEKQIKEQKQLEKQLMKNTLSSLHIIKAKSVMVRTSLLKFDGQINNRLNTNHAEFFKYPIDKISQLNNIDQIMPPLFYGLHRHLIQGIYKKENLNIKSMNRQLFMADQQMFITPINIYLDFCFSDSNNFNMIAVLSKVKSFKRYLLFNQKGFLNGIEQGLYELLIKKVDLNQIQYKNSLDNIQNDIKLIMKFYRSMSMVFMFPQLAIKIFEQADGPSKVAVDMPHYQDHYMLEHKMYFPKDISKFINSFLQKCNDFQFRYVELHGNTISSKSKIDNIITVSNVSIDSKNQSDIDDDDALNHNNSKTFQNEQHNIDMMNFLYIKDRKFAINFIMEYIQNQPEQFSVYNCYFDLICEPINLVHQTVRYWVIQIHSLDINHTSQKIPSFYITQKSLTKQQDDKEQTQNYQEKEHILDQNMVQYSEYSLDESEDISQNSQWHQNKEQIQKLKQELSNQKKTHQLNNLDDKIQQNNKSQIYETMAKSNLDESIDYYVSDHSQQTSQKVKCISAIKWQLIKYISSNFIKNNYKERNEISNSSIQKNKQKSNNYIQSFLNLDEEQIQKKRKQVSIVNFNDVTEPNKKIQHQQEGVIIQKDNKNMKLNQDIMQKGFLQYTNMRNNISKNIKKIYRSIYDMSQYSISDLTQKRFIDEDNDDNLIDGLSKLDKDQKAQIRGLKLIQGIQKSNKMIKIIKFLYLIYVFQMVLVTSIIFMTKELIYQELDIFDRYIDIVNDIDTSISSIQQGFFILNYKYQQDRKLLIHTKNSVFDQYCIKIIESKKIKLKNIIKQKINSMKEISKEEIIFNQLMLEDIDLNTSMRKYKLIRKMGTLSQLITQYIETYEMFLRNPDYFNNDRYFDMRINYSTIFQRIIQVMNKFQQRLENKKSFLLAFILIEGIVIIMILFIMFLAQIPIYKQYIKIIEDILLLITQINEFDGLQQIKLYDQCKKLMKSDNYSFITTQLVSKQNSVTLKTEQEDAKINNNRQKQGTLNRKIQQRELSTKQIKINMLMQIICYGLHFLIYFMIYPQTEQTITYITQVKRQQSETRLNFLNMQIFQQLLLYLPHVDAQVYASNETVQLYKSEYKKSLDFMVKIVTIDSIEIYLSKKVISQQQIQQIKQIFFENTSCQLVNIDNCGPNFNYGINGYISKIVSQQYQSIKFIMNQQPINKKKLIDLFNQQDLDQIIKDIYVFEEMQQKLKSIVNEQAQKLINDVKTSYFYFQVIAGIIIILFFTIQFSYQIQKFNINLKRIIHGLNLIPHNKLSDEVIIDQINKIQQKLI